MNSKEQSPVARAQHCSHDTLALIQLQALLHAVMSFAEATGQISVGPQIRENYQNFRPIKLPSPKIANGPPLQILGIDRANEAAIRPQDKQHTEVLQLRQALG